MFWKKRKILFILATFIVLNALYWWFGRIPWGWKTYTNWKGYRYSFAYPKDWIVSECGDGSVVVGKKPIEKCYFPLEASKEYLDNLYFQVFLPEKYLTGSVFSVNNELDTPEEFQRRWKLIQRGWEKSLPILGGIKYVDGSVPFNPNASSSSSLRKKGIISPGEWFSIGYMSSYSYSYTKKMDKVDKSIRLF